MEVSSTSPCRNCRKPVPTSNLETHESYCERNCQLCTECLELVDNKNIQSHRALHHRACNAKCLLPSSIRHEANCNMRLIYCRYCQVQIPSIELPCHQQLCPMRSRPCRICGGEFIQSNYVAHVLKCQQNSQQLKQNNRIAQKRRQDASERLIKRISSGQRAEMKLDRRQSNRSQASIDKQCRPADQLKNLNRLLEDHRQNNSIGKSQKRLRLLLPTPNIKPLSSQANIQCAKNEVARSNQPARELNPVPICIRYNPNDLHRCSFPGLVPVTEPSP